MKTVFILVFLVSAGISLQSYAQTAIHSAEDLRAMSMSGSYYLTVDLELDDWTSPGVFTGSLDGRGHSITITNGHPDANDNIGLFAMTDGASISNLVIEGRFKRFSGYGGSIVGRAHNTTLSNCETDAFLITENTSAILGGIVGCLDGGSIVNCSSQATLEGYKLGGLAGSVINGGSIKNSYTNSSMVFSKKHASPEVGFLVHDNEGLLENNYVSMQPTGWYIGSYGQLCMMMGVQGLCKNTDSPVIWFMGFSVSSSMKTKDGFFGCTEGVKIQTQNQDYFTGQTKNVKYSHDYHGTGYNLGDSFYVNGVKCFVYYIYDDGSGGWLTPNIDNSFMRLMTTKQSDQLNGYYLSGSYIDAQNYEYAQWHGGNVAHGGTSSLIPEGYDNNPGKFFTYRLQEQDFKANTQVNRIKIEYSKYTSMEEVKQLAFLNTGTIRNCYYPFPLTTYKLVNGVEPLHCSLFVEGLAPYNYGEFGPRLKIGNNTTDLALVDTLNAWVNAQGDDTYSFWTLVGDNQINGNRPIHKYSFDNGNGVVNTALKSGRTNKNPVLRYIDLDATTESHRSFGNTLAYYGSDNAVNADNVTDPWPCDLFVTNDATLKGTYRLKANVGVLFDNSDASGFAGANYDWHMVSSVLADAPVGISYQPYTNGGPFGEPRQVSFNKEEGYFPLNTPYANWDFYCYDEPNGGWPNFKRKTGDHYHHDTGEPINYTNETLLTPGKGYLWAIGKKTGLQAYGTLNNGSINRAVTRQSSFYPGYNLVGNPYQAFLDFDAFAEQNQSMLTQNAYMVLDADKQGYVSYCPGVSSNPLYASRFLNPHQGFFVEVNKNGNIVFNTNQSVMQADSYFRGEMPSYPLVNLMVADAEGRSDYATVELDRPETGGVLKMMGLRVCEAMLSVSHESQEYSIAFVKGRPSQIPIRFRAFLEGDYTLRWDFRNEDFNYVHLIDHSTGREVDCLAENDYVFTASPYDYPSRFALVFHPNSIEESFTSNSQIVAFLSDKRIVVDGCGILELLDIQGRLLRSVAIDDKVNSMPVSDLASGVYVLRLTTHNQTNVQKIIIP